MQHAFHPAIQNWFKNNFEKPSPPQEQGWPVIAAGENALILAPTGSGKTLTAFLACIDNLLHDLLDKNWPQNSVHTLYISPLKALNNDIQRNLQAPLQGIKEQAEKQGLSLPEIRTLVRTGDTPSSVRQSMLRKPPHILITTPESLYLLLTSGRGREIFRRLRYLIIDEIHAISNNKRGVHLSLSLERLMPLCEQEPVRIGLSATQRPLERIAAFLGGQQHDQTSGNYVPRPVHIVDCGQRKEMDIRVIAPVGGYGNLEDASAWSAIVEQLYSLILQHKTTLIFVLSRAQAERVTRRINDLHTKKMADRETDAELVERPGSQMQKPPVPPSPISAQFEPAQLVRAHHGSLSREVRFEVESALKKGKLRAVVATASLELGIDIGSIDLVVQLDAPTSVSSALQRIGRSGHVLSATSKGRILPLYQSELPHAIAITEAILEADVEETQIPELCLDVLSQQILAEVAVQDWSRSTLFDLFRQSYCYRNLTAASFNRVIEMLGGAYEETQIRALQPRLTWDKVNDKLIARSGARLLATMNGGTIPDRGLYDVYLQDANVRVGQVDEEFVFERKVGETFYLGTSEWRIEDIAQDRIVVAPVRAIVPMPPFWKSDYGIPRDFNTMQRVGAFLRELLQQEGTTEAFIDGGGDIPATIDKSSSDTDGSTSAKAPRRANESYEDKSTRRGRLRSRSLDDVESCIDPEITQSLQEFVDSQLDFSGTIATDKRIVFEYFHDSAQQPMLYIQAPFGGRVNQAWAIALATYLGKKYAIEIQYSFNDDGLLFRLLESDKIIDARDICAIPSQQLEEFIIAGLPEAPVFMVLFRYNAGSSLLLTRSRAGKRIPLWLQRLRTADLMQNIQQYPDFPILLETYRDCLENVLDVQNLKKAIEQIQNGDIEVVSVQTLGPSPMANGLMYKFLERNLYELDRNRGAASGGEVHQQALAEILQSGEIPAIIRVELAAQLERRLQHLVHELKAKTAEDVFALLEKLGPLPVDALQQRSHIPVENVLAELQQSGRILQQKDEWLTQTYAEKIKTAAEDEKALFMVQRLLQNLGPMTGKAIQNQLSDYSLERVLKALEILAEKRLVLHGQMIENDTELYWCDRHNFTTLYRQAIAARRQSDGIATAGQFYHFLLQWHQITTPAPRLDALIERYRGYRFVAFAFEREIVHTRFRDATVNSLEKHLQEFSESLANGEVIQRMHRSTEKSPRLCSFHRRGEGHLFFEKNTLVKKKDELDAAAQVVFAFLQENGASLFDDLNAGTDLSRSQILDALKSLVENELLSCDDEQSLQYVVGIQPTNEPQKRPSNELFPDQPWRARARGRRRGMRSGFSQFKQQQKKLRGRWFLTTSFAAHGKEITPELLAEKQARLLLQRYGVLVKEWYRRENGLLPWYRIFTALKRLEWQGDIRRGYFVHGLSGVQYALPQAVQLLEKIQQGVGELEHQVVLISTGDPALPFGGMLQWNVRSSQHENVAITRSFSNHILIVDSKPVLYLENFARRLFPLAGVTEAILPELIAQLKSWLQLPAPFRPVKNITIEFIDGQPATKHRWAAQFTNAGFEQSDAMLVLWPSAV